MADVVCASTAVSLTEVWASSMAVLSVMTWATMMHHVWVRTTVWTGDASSLRVTAMTSSLQLSEMIHHLGLDEGDSEPERLGTVVCELFSFASSGVASDTMTCESTENADGVLVNAIDVVNDLEGLKVYGLASNRLDGDDGVVNEEWLVGGVGDGTVVDVELNWDLVLLSDFPSSMTELGDEGSVDFGDTVVDSDIVDRETVLAGLNGEDQVAEFTFSIPGASFADKSNLLLVVIPDRGLGMVDGVDNKEGR